ncbi:MAG: hypothetical protein QM564_13770 [Bergeyella sp.]
MKKVFLSLAVVATALLYGQKKEISAAVKAIESGNVSEASSQISAAESALGGKTHLLEPAVLEQYYYVKGLALLKSGKTAEGAGYLAKISDLGKETVYSGKDASKNKIYYIGKAAADASGIEGLKQEKYTPVLAAKLAAAVDPIVQATAKTAIDAYNGKKFADAAPKFVEEYQLRKAAGQDNKMLLYYAALAYEQSELSDKNEKAAVLYKQMADADYNGVETTYTAKNAEGTVVGMDKSTWETFKKLGAASGYTDFKTETSKSIEKDIYEGLMRTLYNSKQYDEVIKYSDAGLKKFPGNTVFTNLKGLSYYNSGKAGEFVETLKKQVQENPKDVDAWMNLGAMLKDNPDTLPEAIKAYQNAAEIDPKNTNAWASLAYLTIGDDSNTMAEYEKLRKAGKIDEANKIIETRRGRLAKALPYAEKWHEAKPDDIEAVSLLRGIYTSTKNEAKAKEFKAKEEALKAQGK